MAAGRDAVARAADVVVVGAGPGGAAAAIGCAAQGLRVVLLDRCELPRPRPGETLHPGVEAPLRELGALDRVERTGFPRHTGIEVAWNAPARLEPYGADEHGAWRGYQAHRADFDALLVARARELGVEVRAGCRALGALRAGGRVAGVRSAQGALPAGHVVDAAGGGHWLARRLGLALDRRSPRLIARFGYAVGECPARDAVPAIAADRAGWTWTARVRPGHYHWTRLHLAGPPGGAAAPPAELAALRPLGRTRSADVSWRAVGRAAGPGYVAVGDAALVLDPASSHGVLRALLTGLHAARLICAVRADPRREPELAAEYSGFVAGWFEHDAAALRELYGRLSAPPSWVRSSRSPISAGRS